MQKGYAGYALIKEDMGDGGTIGHAIFCQNCGNEIATMYMNFLPPQAPQVGTRTDILTRLAKYATDQPAMAALQKKKAQATGPMPIEKAN